MKEKIKKIITENLEVLHAKMAMQQKAVENNDDEDYDIYDIELECVVNFITAQFDFPKNMTTTKIWHPLDDIEVVCRKEDERAIYYCSELARELSSLKNQLEDTLETISRVCV